jgi:hypothetical protein
MPGPSEETPAWKPELQPDLASQKLGVVEPSVEDIPPPPGDPGDERPHETLPVYGPSHPLGQHDPMPPAPTKLQPQNERSSGSLVTEGAHHPVDPPDDGPVRRSHPPQASVTENRAERTTSQASVRAEQIPKVHPGKLQTG